MIKCFLCFYELVSEWWLFVSTLFSVYNVLLFGVYLDSDWDPFGAVCGRCGRTKDASILSLRQHGGHRQSDGKRQPARPDQHLRRV